MAQFEHSDIDFGLDGQKIVTNKSVYDSFFPTFGIAKQFSSNPGFSAESDGVGTLGSRHELVYDVLDNLFLWDGTELVTPSSDVQIRIENNPPGTASTFVGVETGVQIGSAQPPVNRIAASSNRGEVHSHVNFFLESEESDPLNGAYGIKMALSTDSDQIVDSDPIFVVFNFGLDESTFDQAMLFYEQLLESPGLVGDFDNSGALDAADIDLMSDAIQANQTDPKFDLNGDTRVDGDDHRSWVLDLRATYFGDANMDGEFSSQDFITVFQFGEYEDGVPGNSTWVEGDWNGDRDFDTNDFVLAFKTGGYEKGPRAAVAVPEPSGWIGILFGLGMTIKFGKRK